MVTMSLAAESRNASQGKMYFPERVDTGMLKS